jgi:Tfp pilus assembly protein PilF
MSKLQRAWSRSVVWVSLAFGARDRALVELQAMLAAEPDNTYALASRASLHAQAGNKIMAVRDFERVGQIDANNAAAHYNHGYLLNELGRLDEAEAAFKRAHVANPKLDLAWYGLGLVHIQQGRLDDALAALKKNTKLQPMSPYGWYQLARVHVDRKEPEEAAKIIRHLRGFEPKVADQLSRETGLGAG